MKPLPPAYRTSEKVQRAISSAQSYMYNPSNREMNWHSIYGLVLHDLTNSYTNLIPQVQYTQWRSEIDRYPEITHELERHVHPDNVSESGGVSEPNSDDEGYNANDATPDSPTLQMRKLRPRAAAEKGPLQLADSDSDLDEKFDDDFEDSVQQLPLWGLLGSSESNRTRAGPTEVKVPDLVVLHNAVLDMSDIELQSALREKLEKAKGERKAVPSKAKGKRKIDVSKTSQAVQEEANKELLERIEAVRTAKRFGMQTIHLCPALIGEMKTNLSRRVECERLAREENEENNKAILQ